MTAGEARPRAIALYRAEEKGERRKWRVASMALESVESQLVAKLQWAWADGCPVAGSSRETWADMAKVVRRRWNSFGRRNENRDDNRENRIEDLARVLCEKFEHGGLRMAGPLISDYRWLAEQLVVVLVAESE
jgi:hypothetical protein